MTYTVIKPFFDKTENLKPYKIGDSYHHDDEKRIAFLIKEGYLKEIITPRKRTTRKKASE